MGEQSRFFSNGVSSADSSFYFADSPHQPEVIPNPFVTQMTELSDETEDNVCDTKL